MPILEDWPSNLGNPAIDYVCQCWYYPGMKPQKTFGDAVAAWLASTGRVPFTAQAVLGATDSTIHNWLSGTCLPPATRLPGLAAALKIPIGDLRAMVARDRAARSRRGKQVTK